MFWEVIGSAVVGLATVTAAFRLLPGRFADRRLAAGTGMTGALLGGVITGYVLGGHASGVPLLAALIVAAAGMSLLVSEHAPARDAVGARKAARIRGAGGSRPSGRPRTV